MSTAKVAAAPALDPRRRVQALVPAAAAAAAPERAVHRSASLTLPRTASARAGLAPSNAAAAAAGSRASTRDRAGSVESYDAERCDAEFFVHVEYDAQDERACAVAVAEDHVVHVAPADGAAAAAVDAACSSWAASVVRLLRVHLPSTLTDLDDPHVPHTLPLFVSASLNDVHVAMAIVYMSRMMQRAKLRLSCNGIKQTFAAAMLVAQKYAEDRPRSNRYFSRCTAMTVRHINALECQFLAKNEFNLRIEPADLAAALRLAADLRLYLTPVLLARNVVAPA